MELSGPCFVIVKDGLTINKYELVARVRTPKGTFNTLYYFNNEEDADIYKMYLFQQEGAKELNRLISSERTYKHEKRDYRAFRDSVDWETLPNRVKKMDVKIVKSFVPARGKK